MESVYWYGYLVLLAPTVIHSRYNVVLYYKHEISPMQIKLLCEEENKAKLRDVTVFNTVPKAVIIKLYGLFYVAIKT
jgi:hypothetical protein